MALIPFQNVLFFKSRELNGIKNLRWIGLPNGALHLTQQYLPILERQKSYRCLKVGCGTAVGFLKRH